MVAFFFFRATHVLVLRCTSSSFFCLFVLKNSLSFGVCCFLPQKFYFLFSNLPSNLPFKKKSNLLHSPHGRKKNDLLFLLTVVVLAYYLFRSKKKNEELRRTTKKKKKTHKRENEKRELLLLRF